MADKTISRISEGQSVNVGGTLYVTGQEKELTAALKNSLAGESDEQAATRFSRDVERLAAAGVINTGDESSAQPAEERAGVEKFVPGAPTDPSTYPEPRPGGRRETNPALHPIEDVTLSELPGHISTMTRDEVLGMKSQDTRKGAVEVYQARLDELAEAEKANAEQ